MLGEGELEGAAEVGARQVGTMTGVGRAAVVSGEAEVSGVMSEGVMVMLGVSVVAALGATVVVTAETVAATGFVAGAAGSEALVTVAGVVVIVIVLLMVLVEVHEASAGVLAGVGTCMATELAEVGEGHTSSYSGLAPSTPVVRQ